MNDHYYVVKMLSKYCTGSGDDTRPAGPGTTCRRSKAYAFSTKDDANVFIAAWSRMGEYYECTMRPVRVNRG